MKIRSGLVSNSSSSSFIVRFPKDPTDINNLREMMGDCVPNCGYSWMTCPTAEEVVQQVHRDLGGHMGDGFESYYDDKRYEWETYKGGMQAPSPQLMRDLAMQLS